MSDVQELIIQTANSVFTDHCTHEALRRAEQGEWLAELWSLVEQTGLHLVSLPETQGGVGGSLRDALAVLRIAGQFAVPLPLAETYLAGWLLTASGVSLPSGPLTVACLQAGPEVHFRRQAGYWIVNGLAERVPWARYAERIVLLGESQDGFCLAMIEPSKATIATGENLAGEPRDTVSLQGVRVQEIVPAAITRNWLWNRFALTRVALIVGALEGVLQLSVRYSAERVQFGRPINRFQAIQQHLALLAGEVIAARTGLEAAALAAEQGEVTEAVAVAKVRAGEAAGQGAAIAHQVHGAMGYTYEYPLHFLTKRLWAWRDEAGSESEWAIQLGHFLASQGAEALWPFLTL